MPIPSYLPKTFLRREPVVLSTGLRGAPLGYRGPQPQRIVPHAESREYFATCHPGLEDVVVKELLAPSIGAGEVERSGRGGVSFRGSFITGVKAVFHLRSAIRVLEYLHDGPIEPSRERSAADEIYDVTKEAGDWSKILHRSGMTMGVHATLSNSEGLNTSQIVVARVRDAVCDSVRDATGMRPPPPNRGDPVDLPLFATVHNSHLTIYRDVGGGSLHRRGYRTGVIHKAALNESAAAGILRLAQVDQLFEEAFQRGGHDLVLVDPMCGSGTFLIEAALMATNTPPGLLRFGRDGGPFQTWKEFEAKAYRSMLEEAYDRRRDPAKLKGVILGNEINRGALQLALDDSAAAGVASGIEFKNVDASELKLQRPPTLVITNPPWGLRLDGSGGDYDDPSTADDVSTSWRSLSSCLKGQCGNSTAYVLSGNSTYSSMLRMKADRRYPLVLGSAECRLLQYRVLPPKPREAGQAEQAPAGLGPAGGHGPAGTGSRTYSR